MAHSHFHSAHVWEKTEDTNANANANANTSVVFEQQR